MSGETVDSLRKRAQNEATCFALNDLLKEVQAERDQLRAELAGMKAQRMSYAYLFPMDENGEPATGRIHENIRTMQAELTAIRASEPFAWAEFDGEGGYDLRLYEYNETFHDEYIKRNGAKYRDWVQPLYTAPQPQPDVAGLVEALKELSRCAPNDWVATTADNALAAYHKK